MSDKPTFDSVLNKFREFSLSERDKGFQFERLMQVYLQTDPQYANLFSSVFLWNEFPFRKDFGGKDTGIDLVARTIHGDYWAIQCKCFQETALIDKPAVDSFLSTSSRSFVNENYQTVEFAHRLWISTTNHWGANAEEAIQNQSPGVSRINLYQLRQAPVDWEKLEQGLSGKVSRDNRKTLFPHQLKAVNAANEYFSNSERGKLIMACGTGKTFTSLKIAEKETDGKGLILFFVPSIALLGQILKEWSAEANETINAICVCSDPEVSSKKVKKEDSDGYGIIDLALPASTNVNDVVRQFKDYKNASGMTVVFSTYQSISVISQAQKKLIDGGDGFGIFDLVICDEAHRTTGVTLAKEDSSAFVKVHDNNFLRAKKRLYMTATPRLYSDDSKLKAAKADAELCSMDDANLYGGEIYRIGFGEAVEKDLLSDYKVLILTINENDMPAAVQAMVADSENEINADDASKLIGCINALSKRILGDADIIKNSDPEPMRSAVAFCQNIKISKRITKIFNETTDIYSQGLPLSVREKLVSVTSEHVDGTMSAPLRDEKLSWLKSSDGNKNECRILTNVRCLSEGVDVPSLDAVLFLSARNSLVDVVQSVGRVMRKSPGKKYGYIVIPIFVPADVEPDAALDNNERYKVVWSVLNALRAHDDRFNATINKIELNKKNPGQILVGKPDNYSDEGSGYESVAESTVGYNANEKLNRQLSLQFEQLQGVVFARMVQKVGDRRYWEQWAKDIVLIVESYIERINIITRREGDHKKTFEAFLNGLKININPSITRGEAIEMLAQHLITKPVFEALFDGYSFVKNNPISISMQKMIDLLEAQSIEKDAETLQKFYESVKTRASGIDNAEGKQRVIIELYDKFFKTAFPKMVEKLGIVYTPVEVVDFIVHSVEHILRKEFGRSISDENIHILDPFTGTGTFITRLLQSGLIRPEDLERKYGKEIHANEIVLLAYYIAAINIENAYHDALEDKNTYKPFEGICLTDTFQLGETDASEELFAEMFPQNSERVAAQKNAPLRVIMGNPPYSIGQKSANDNAQNQKYSKLDARIEETYAQTSKATSVKALYDSYIKAFRWSADRLDKNNGGIIAFVSNSNWLEGSGMDGFRKSLEKEFSAINIFNLRGNQRTSGELSRKEGGKIFGSGSRTPIAITLLVKNPKSENKNALIQYYDIGDYLSRDEKLKKLSKYNSVSNPEIDWQILSPNEHGDWLNQRTDIFETYFSVAPDRKYNNLAKSYFVTYSLGVGSNRDSWVYNCSKYVIETNVKETIKYYNEQVVAYQSAKKTNPTITAEDFIGKDPKKISWSSSLVPQVGKGAFLEYSQKSNLIALYRPFYKQHLYFGEKLIHRKGQFAEFFPNKDISNIVICVSGLGGNKDNSVLMTANIPDLNCLDAGTQCFPLYYYDKQEKDKSTLFEEDKILTERDYIWRDGVSDYILEQARKIYGKAVTKEDIFYYVYGFLHSPEYRERFSSDLKKMLPRIPLADEPRDFWNFSKAGRKLAELHINYESVPPADGVIVTGIESGFFQVEKMKFQSKNDKGTILFNSKITVENIPAAAYEYVVNGKSAIEWIMERYAVTTHKESGIKNDPNDWMPENPRYILDLLLSVIRVSVETVGIVKGLPKLIING